MLNEAEFIPVSIRCRPLSQVEMLKSGTQTPIEIDHLKKELTIINPKADPKEENQKPFHFDNIFDSTASQESVYKEVGVPVVEAFLSGTDGAIFVYGQTGAGKTYTMEGILESEEHKGIIPRVFEHIFRYIESSAEEYHSVHLSYILIYNEKIRDLLSETPNSDLALKERENIGVYVQGMKLVSVKSLEECYEQLQIGKKNKIFASGYPNRACCRSHSILSVTLDSYKIEKDSQKQIRSRKLDLVDMASCERTNKITSNHRELIQISQSLSNFCHVISSLSKRDAFIRYRDSKLTRILQKAFETAVIAFIGNISPSIENYEESLSTLRLCTQVNQIKINSTIKKLAVNPSPLEAFLSELNKLKGQMPEIYTAQMLENISFEELQEVFASGADNEKEVTKKDIKDVKPN